MTVVAYYNEIDPYAAQWLRNLIAAGHIAPGDVDERSILEVRPDDLRNYTQCHFFAGIGGWSLALRIAGWPDDRPVWTGSCPCQPFSAAGKQRGSEDERHLWPAFFSLIREHGPSSVFGEQVAGAAGLAWLDHVCADLEGAGYAAAAADLCAAGAGAPHIRQRLYWVAHADGGHASAEREQRSRQQRQQPAHGGAGALAHAERGAAERRGHDLAGAARTAEGEARQRQWLRDEPGASGDAGDLADPTPGGFGINGSASGQARHAALGNAACGLADSDRRGQCGCSECDVDAAQPAQSAPRRYDTGRCGAVCGLGDIEHAFHQRQKYTTDHEWAQGERSANWAGRPSASSGGLDAWADLAWIECSDGKARPTKPGLFPLAHGVSNRVGRLRAYGNAIVPQVAAAFIRSMTDPA